MMSYTLKKCFSPLLILTLIAILDIILKICTKQKRLIYEDKYRLIWTKFNRLSSI